MTGFRWGRLVAEGAAIVVSILLAFAIDASWDARQARVRERDVLEALERDFLQNRTQVGEAIAVHEAAQARVARLQAMSEDEILALERDSVGVFLGSLAAPRTFDPMRGTVDALVGAGELGLLRDARLREAVASFLNAVDDADEDARYMAEFAVRIWEGLIRHGGPWDVPLAVTRPGRRDFLPPPSREALAAIRADAELMGLVRQMRQNAWVYVGEMERVAAQVDTVLVRVESGLR